MKYFPVFMCLSLSSLLLGRADEMFATDFGAMHSVHCLTRSDVAFNPGCTQLQYMRWRQGNRVDVRLDGDQEQMGNARVRTRTVVIGSTSSFRVYGGAVGLMFDLI